MSTNETQSCSWPSCWLRWSLSPGCMCILITVDADGGRWFGVRWMSSNYHRISSVEYRIASQLRCNKAYYVVMPTESGRHAAVNSGRSRVMGLGSGAGGEAGERHDTAYGVDRGGVVASESRWGVRAVVHRRVGFLSGLRQGAGEVRDVAGASGRGRSCGRSGCRTWLFEGCFLSGGGGVRSVGDGGAPRRAARPSRPGQMAPGDRGLHPRRGRVGGTDRRAGRRPVRGAVAPTHHRAGARPVSTRSFWPAEKAAQVDYETLRAHTLEHGGLPASLAAARFARRGLAGLIALPSAQPVFAAYLRPCARPAWTPYEDPRVAALAAGYEFLLDLAASRDPCAALSVRGLR